MKTLSAREEAEGKYLGASLHCSEDGGALLEQGSHDPGLPAKTALSPN